MQARHRLTGLRHNLKGASTNEAPSEPITVVIIPDETTWWHESSFDTDNNDTAEPDSFIFKIGRDDRPDEPSSNRRRSGMYINLPEQIENKVGSFRMPDNNSLVLSAVLDLVVFDRQGTTPVDPNGGDPEPTTFDAMEMRIVKNRRGTTGSSMVDNVGSGVMDWFNAGTPVTNKWSTPGPGHLAEDIDIAVGVTHDIAGHPDPLVEPLKPEGQYIYDVMSIDMTSLMQTAFETPNFGSPSAATGGGSTAASYIMYTNGEFNSADDANGADGENGMWFFSEKDSNASWAGPGGAVDVRPRLTIKYINYV